MVRLFAVTALVGLAAAANANEPINKHPNPLATYPAPSSGFIDDAFAIREDGKAIAWLTTNGASESTLHIAELGAAPHDITGLPATVVALHWLSSDRILIVTHDSARHTVSGQVYTEKGPSKEKLGPASAIALSRIGDKAAVIAFTRAEKRSPDNAVMAYDHENLKLLAKKVLRNGPDGRLMHPAGPFKPLWWYDGNTAVATLKAGEFDKARDMRRPDRFARLQIFDNKLLEEHDIEDVIEFTRIANEHDSHPGEEAFVHLSEDHQKLLLTDGLLENEIQLPRPLALYDAETLRYQILDGNRVAFSMTIDPVNPAAVKRQKADPDDLDLYFADRHSRAVTPQVRLSGQGRPNAWRIAGARIGVLRKSKGFDRGGVSLEIYDLSPATAASQ
jgi:hypothetical protein